MTLKVIISLHGSDAAPGLQHIIITDGILTFAQLQRHVRIFYERTFPTDVWDMRLRCKTDDVGADGLPPLLRANDWHREAWEVYTRDGEVHVVISFMPKPGTGLMGMLEAVRRMEYGGLARGMRGGAEMKEVEWLGEERQPLNHAGENEYIPPILSESTSGEESADGWMSLALVEKDSQAQNRARHDTEAPSIAEVSSDVSPTPPPAPEISTPTPLQPYPTLPSNLTPQTFCATLRANLHSDVPHTHKFHVPNRNWSTFTPWRKNGVAKALMIEGEYGVDAQRPCACCVKRGRKCRVWHPEIKEEEEWRKGNCVKGGEWGVGVWGALVVGVRRSRWLGWGGVRRSKED
ncbi:hypothetical protein PTMSG1_03924 [Pyrenophora teres f. maculata]|nr:hypothetical protein PTMSG1_03924 [Pyrenophora teres f. maculata]